MKECPKCKNVYTDETLSFCLSDGTPLVLLTNEAATEEYSNLAVGIKTQDETIPPTQFSNRPTEETVIKTAPIVTTRQGVSPVWIFATFGLLGVIVIGFLLTWFIIRQNSGDKNAELQTNSNINIKNTSSTQTADQETNNISQEIKKTDPAVDSDKTEKLYRITGVKSNDVLYIRPQAGNLKVVAGKIPPNGKGIKIIGGSKKIGKSRWVFISYNGTKGWVNSKFITLQK